MLLLILSGCAGQGATKTGFIADYTDMKPTGDHTDDLIYVRPGFALNHYQAALIDPVVWHPVGKAPHLQDEVVARMTSAFHAELVQQVGKSLPIVQTGACGDCAHVLHIKAAITNIRRSKWYYNIVPMVLGLGASAAGGVLPPIPPPAPGGASEEIEVVDGNGDVLVAVSTYNNGMPWNPVGQITPYGHARRAFHIASNLLVLEMKAGRS